MKKIPSLYLLALILILGATAHAIPRPEYPLPQFERAQWLNLNGTWDYAETNDDSQSFLGQEAYPEEIVVPFCRESELSGLSRTGFMKNAWYRREFVVPSDWQAERIFLHIGACDWFTTVWVNDVQIGTHRGGYSHFAFEITKALKPGANTVTIHAFDDSAGGLQPLGKQSRQEKSAGIFYTRTTGIWQTVWLEGTHSAYVADFQLTPDITKAQVRIQADVVDPLQNLTLTATAFADGRVVGKASTPVTWRNTYLTLDLSLKRLWTVEDPFLYDLKLTLQDGEQVLDEISSYFGLRSVHIQGGAILINGEPVFQRLVLDQGFYPDGIWTAPSDAALKGDIELSKAVGFNGARLHQKVFEPRFLYWADKLGYLVWGEYPSYGADYHNPIVNMPYMQEWVEIVRRDRNHPSVIGWCAFNETPDSAGELQNAVVALTRALDPSRPVLDTSGWVHSLPDPELSDAHDYNQNPESLKQYWMDYFKSTGLPQRYGAKQLGIPFFISEFGGIGWFERQDNASWGYGNNPKTLEEFYARFKGLVDALMDNPNLFGFCYTQLTDIEQEKNGVYYYNRQPKFDAALLREIMGRPAAYEQRPPLTVAVPQEETWQVLVGSAIDAALAKTWTYTTTQPGDGWMNANFDVSGWETGRGGFGKKDGAEKWIHTPWNTRDIWLRQEFTYSGESIQRAVLAIHYDNATEIYLNGEKIWSRSRWNDGYQPFDLTEIMQKHLKKGTNTLAVHTHQDDGGQFIDLAILLQ
ncbi:MAG: glycoside hydrolase family 2 TIM barrel-domain containing protein [bacterium]|jgi:hypothetical protein|nr:glycoside hydrolase family 2 TIM barrel-domain containing protein [bacterium]